MAILERITRNIDSRAWNPGAEYFPVKNRYTAGVAGQRFFEELKENGRIMGATCASCSLTFVPARTYCERCFARLEEKDWMDVGLEGTLFAFTELHRDKSGGQRNEPVVIAAVRLADGLLIHRLMDCPVDEIKTGMKIRVELKPKAERRGGLDDISCFKSA